MRKVRIIVGNPRDEQSMMLMTEAVNVELAAEATLTWLQSSASFTTGDGTTGDEHVLTCVAERIEPDPYVPPTPQARRKR